MRLPFYIAVLLLLIPAAAQAADISETDLRVHIEILASDEFGGRKPGTAGENKTVNYIAAQLQKAGLQPATNSASWYAPVALVDRTPLRQVVEFSYARGKKLKSIRMDDNQVILRGAVQSARVSHAPVVFVGCGNFPEDEMAPLITGKLAIMLMETPDTEGFPDYRTRKANVIAAGASGVITVISSKSRFDRSARRFRKTSTSLDWGKRHADLEGLLSGAAADKLFDKAGVDFKLLSGNARQDDFRPRGIDIHANLSVETRIRAYQSHNVIGKIAGNKQESGAVLFLAHWDHLGKCRPEPAVDRICNGAVDNASGIALLIETAKRLAKEQSDRDLYFLATTAEESGLLGARAFVESSGFPLGHLVAVFNADTVALSPMGKIIAVVGRGHAGLDEDIAKVALAEGREIDTSDKANAFMKRQDGYVFLERDIPAYMITSAFADQEHLDSYLDDRYHDVGDEADDGLLLGGAAADANFHVALGRYFGSVDSFPEKPTPKATTDIVAPNSITE